MLFGVGCTPEGEEADGAKAEITVSPATISATLEGTTETLQVTSNADWVVTCDQSDVVVSTLVGRGNTAVTVEIPPVTAARNFVIKFTASKMMSVAGVTVPSTKSFDVQVSQNATGTNLNNYAYYEDCGEDVEKVPTSTGGTAWPYIDQFFGWNPQGEAAANVTYVGKSASVRASGGNYQPTEDAIGISGQPYVFLNKPVSSANFVIENIAVKGGAQYIFTFNTSCQTAYTPLTFAEISNNIVHLELGYDGTNWAAVNFTATPNGGNGWYATTTEFKVAADATKLYARLTYEQGGGSTQETGCRLDDFKLIEGGNGAELNITAAPVEPGLPEQPTDPLTLPYIETFASNQGYFTIENTILPEGLSYVWAWAENYGMKGSAFANNTSYAAESWLVSPQISLVGATAPVVTFSHCVNKLNNVTPAEVFTLHVKEVGGEWAQLTIPTHGTGNSWSFVDSGEVDLSAYVGKNVQIGFKYTSTASDAGTWEIKNFKVAEKEVAQDGVVSIVFNTLGYTNGESVDGKTIVVDDNISLVFKKASASTAPAYYDASQGIRMYQNGSTLDVTAANGKVITSIEFEFDYNMYYLICDNGELSANNAIRTWTGESSAIKFTCNGTDKNSRAYIKKMKISYK